MMISCFKISQAAVPKIRHWHSTQPMQVRAIASTYLLLSASRYAVLASQVKTCPSHLLSAAGSSATMATQAAKSSTAGDALAQNQPAQTKGANAGVGPSPPSGQSLSPNVLKLVDIALSAYTARTEQEITDIIKQHYTEKCNFIDPLANVYGHKDMTLQFYSLQKIFSKVEIDKQTPTLKAQKDGLMEVLVPNKQGYTLAREGWLSKHMLPERVDLQTNTVLTIEESSGRIARHSDTWEGKPTPPRFLRSINAATTNFFMRMFGLERQLKMKTASGL